MNKAVVAVAALAAMVALLVMFKKRVDSEADGTAYASHEPSLGDKLFGNGKYAGGRALGTGESEDAEGEEEPSPIGDALASLAGSEDEAEADAEAEDDVEDADAEAEAEADDSAERAKFDEMIAEAEAAAAETAPDSSAVGLTRALGAEESGKPKGFVQKRLTVERSIELDAPVAHVWACLGDGEEGQTDLVPHQLRRIEGPKHTLWQLYEPLDGGRTKLTLRSRPTSLGARIAGPFSRGGRGRKLEQLLEEIKVAVEGSGQVATTR